MRFLIIVFLFLGCAKKTTPIYAVIKTPYLKVANSGFLIKAPTYKKIILYQGVKPFEITIKHSLICLENKCVKKALFFKKIGYESDFFDKILNCKKPMQGRLICKKDKILFKDKDIIILIKFLKDE